ncbi:MAG: DUF2845 domain-containing protein [Desulfuromonadaceae bacterium]|nr:DUF2845 domain-containing protein [Desulfuromonadaceae bacterium]MDD5105072.1 DUF2845 domain-containing protein [Desulfuromonadaceae bacterium]
MKLIIAVCSVLSMFSPSLVLADTFRCPNGNLVSTGDKTSAVSAKCDSPDSVVSRTEPIEVEAGTDWNTGNMIKKIVYIEVQEWTYTKGSNLLHTLVFRNGVLSEVITGGFVR